MPELICLRTDGFKYCYLTLIIRFNIICTLLNRLKYGKWLNICIWLIDGTLTDISIPGLNRPQSNDIEGVLHIPPNSKTGALSSDAVSCHKQDTRREIRGSYSSIEIQLAYITALSWKLTKRKSKTVGIRS